MRLTAKAIRDVLRQIESLPVVSASLVGSFRLSRKIRKVDDIDVHVVVGEPIEQSYNRTFAFFEKLALDLSSENTTGIVETRRGPFKPKYVAGRYVVQLHMLIDTKATLGDLPLVNLVDWSNQAMPLAGYPLRQLIVNHPTRDQLVMSAIECLQKKRAALIDGRIPFRAWTWRGQELLLRGEAVCPTDKLEELELLRFSALVGLADYAVAMNPKLVTTTRTLLAVANRSFPEYVPFLQEVSALRHSYRDTGFLGFDYGRLREEGLKFVNELLARAVSAAPIRNSVGTVHYP